MSFSIADLASCPIPLRVEVRDKQGVPTGEVLEYLVHPLTFRDHGNLQRWIDAQFPSPLEQAWEEIDRRRAALAARGEPPNVAQEQFLLRNAQELAMRAPHRIGSPEADRLLTSAEGMRRIIFEGIRKGDPGFDEAKLDRLMDSMTEIDVVRAFAATQANMVVGDPKAGPLDVTPRSRTTGCTASRRTRRAAKGKGRTGGKSGTA